MICIEDFNGRGIEGNFNIKAGTECDLINGYICYKNKVVCHMNSDTGQKYFQSNVTAD